jgi:putative ABC transport system ATP-binding protein
VESEQKTENREGALVELEHLSKTFPEGETQRTVLSQVSLTISPAEFIAPHKS